MPAELGDARGDLHQLVLRREVDQPLDEVEAHAAHAGGMQRAASSASVTVRRTVATPRALPFAATQASTIARLSAPWQVACTITLRAKPEVVAQREQLRLAGVAGRVLALGRDRETRRRGRTRGSARRRAGRQHETAASWDRSYQSSQPRVLVKGPVVFLLMMLPCWYLALAGAAGSGKLARGHARKGVRSASVRQSPAREGFAAPLAEPAGIGQVGHPGLALRGAAGRPGVEARFTHGLRHLAHFLGAAAAVFDHALEEVGPLFLPVDAWKGFLQRSNSPSGLVS